jgi:hypothetical protein
MVDEALLRYYAREWDRYTTGANYVNRLFTYLNRHWVKREKDEGRKNVYQVYTVCISSGATFIVLTSHSSVSSNGSSTSSSMSKTSTPNWHLPSSNSSSPSETERPSIKVSLKKSSIPLVPPHFPLHTSNAYQESSIPRTRRIRHEQSVIRGIQRTFRIAIHCRHRKVLQDGIRILPR